MHHGDAIGPGAKKCREELPHLDPSVDISVRRTAGSKHELTKLVQARELCPLADTRPRVRNVSVAVREHQGDIVFLRQIVDGGSSRSYGIDVARLAGLPRSVVSRARQILGTLEGNVRLGRGTQLSLFSAAQSAPPAPEPDRAGEILDRLRGIDPHRITPLQALELLTELCQRM